MPELCNVQEASCFCAREPHDPAEAHECECGGSWKTNEEGEFVLVRLPPIPQTSPIPWAWGGRWWL